MVKTAKKPSRTRKNASPEITVQIRPYSSMPPEQQLVAQLKLAVMLGELKPGQTLPSVRELAARAGLGRNVVWRAYSKLAELGAFSISERRRAVVASNHSREKASELVAVYEWLGAELLQRIRALRIDARSFLRYLDHRLQESEPALRDLAVVDCSKVHAQSWAEEISRLWGVGVHGYDIQTVQGLTNNERLEFKTVLTPLQHYEEVRDLFRNPYTQVVPLKYGWDGKVIRELQTLPEGSVMALVFGESGYSDPWVREMQTICPNLRIEVVSFESWQQVKHLKESGRYARIHVSGTVLDVVYDEIRSSPLFLQQPLKLERHSLEEARIKAGVVL